MTDYVPGKGLSAHWGNYDLKLESDIEVDFSAIELPHRFRPRHYQVDLLNTFFGMLNGENNIKQYCLVQHRRSGKDVALFQLMVAAAANKRGDYAYFLPLSNQARRVIVNGIVQDSDGNPCKFMDFIPQALFKRYNSVDSFFELTNGSKIYVTGSDNYNSLVGMNIHGAVFSEWSLCTPLAYDYIKPMINQNNGWTAFCFTPRGRNHAYDTLMTALKEENKHRWFTTMLTINDTTREDGTPVVTQQMIEDDLADGMDESTIQQEYYLDFTAAVKGIIYSKEMQLAREEKRIRPLKISHSKPVFTFWDVGISKGNATAIWCMQQGEEDALNLIHYIEMEDEPATYFLEKLQEFCLNEGVQLGTMYMPHDSSSREWVSGVKRHEQIIQMGYDVEVLPRISDVELGIRQTKAIFHRLHFDENNCWAGLSHLDRYRRKVSPTTGMLGGPLHDDSSNCADALRQLGQFYADKYVDHRHSPEVHERIIQQSKTISQNYNIGSINNTLFDTSGYDPFKPL